MIHMKFKNKTVVITGAAGGIGTEITKRFLKEGARVVAVDLSIESLKKLNLKFNNTENLYTVEADISSQKDAQQLYQKIKDKWDSTDIIVNNAGWFPFQKFEEMNFTDWKKVMNINLDGVFLTLKNLWPFLKQSTEGRIINVASGSFFNPPPGQSHYVAAKAGIIGLTRALAIELGDSNITVNAVTPGLTATPKVVETFPPELIHTISQHGALKRKQKAEDLIGTISFLASDDAAFITGQTINVDGGRSFI